MADLATFLDAYRALILELDANPFGFLPASEPIGLDDGWSAEVRAGLTPILTTKDGSVVASLAGPHDAAGMIVWLDSEGSGPFALAASLADFLSLLPYGALVYDIASAIARYRENPALFTDPAEGFASAYAERIVARAALADGPPAVEPEDPDDEVAWAMYTDRHLAMFDGFVRALAWVEERVQVARQPYTVVASAAAGSAERMAWLAAGIGLGGES